MGAEISGGVRRSKAIRIAVLGAGSWGSALAMQLARSGAHCVLWARSPEHVMLMRESGRNDRFLPGISFPESLEFDADLERTLACTDEVLIAVPTSAFTGLLERVAVSLRADQGLSWACKGLEPGTGRFLHQSAQAKLGMKRALAVVTGPSFAAEVARYRSVLLQHNCPGIARWQFSRLHQQ
jgi:glycerol-3-phosphate dehydrogenase (NAD(P)+)